MSKRTMLCFSLAALLGFTASAHAVDIDKAASKLGAGSSKDAKPGLGDALGGNLGFPALGADNVGSAAGVLEYCIKNKYLGNASAEGVKDKLLGKLGGEKEKDAGYQSGLGGMLGGSDGKSFDLSKVSDPIKTKACDYVLDQAGSLL